MKASSGIPRKQLRQDQRAGDETDRRPTQNKTVPDSQSPEDHETGYNPDDVDPISGFSQGQAE
jgi:hypothetical protein